jgi:hypothetical protein
MKLQLNKDNLSDKPIKDYQMESYVAFRSVVPKPTSEGPHLRHILRFYLARAFSKSGYTELHVLPEVLIDGEKVQVDVAAGNGPTQEAVAICEPDSITPATEEKLEKLRNLQDVEIVVLHSQFGKPGNVPAKFKSEIDSGKIKLMAVVPPPFDDVYEYDIWMFETTFRNQFAR